MGRADMGIVRMRHRTQSEEVERLSGFLYGISTFSGNLRQYESFAYLIDLPNEFVLNGNLIKQYFRGQHEFSLGASEELQGGLKDVEIGIREYLIRDQGCVRSEMLQEMRRYVSFRVIDMIRDVFDSFGKRLDASVSKIQDDDSSSPGRSTFFCIRSRGLLLVLQFNEDTDRK